MFLAAFASLRDPESKTFYDRKRAALIWLTRQRCDVLLAMLCDQQPYLTPSEHETRDAARPAARAAQLPPDKKIGTLRTTPVPPAAIVTGVSGVSGVSGKRCDAGTNLLAITFANTAWEL